MYYKLAVRKSNGEEQVIDCFKYHRDMVRVWDDVYDTITGHYIYSKPVFEVGDQVFYKGEDYINHMETFTLPDGDYRVQCYRTRWLVMDTLPDGYRIKSWSGRVRDVHRTEVKPAANLYTRVEIPEVIE